MIKRISTHTELKELLNSPKAAYVLFGYGNGGYATTLAQFGVEGANGYLIPGALLNEIFKTEYDPEENFFVIIPADTEMVKYANGETLFDFIYELEETSGISFNGVAKK